jgi:hypothetical protein
MTATAAETASSGPRAAAALAVQLRYAVPGRLTSVRFTFGGADDDWVEADGWTQAGPVFTAPDGTRWDFTAVQAVPGDRAAVTYHGWFIPAALAGRS